MKKGSLMGLAIACILSLCILTGLLVYAFQLQSEKDQQERNSEQNNVNTSNQDNPDASSNTAAPTDAAGASSPDSSGQAAPADTDPGETITPTPSSEPSDAMALATDKPIILGFAGDVNLDENSDPVAKYDSEGKGILGGLSEDLVKEMNNADVMMLNNEFAYSTRGTKTPDKSYTFRADPSRVDILKEMGVDIVSLANNHALDFGPDALEDTFTTLDKAGIDYVGAGDNLDRAKAPVYYEIGGKKIAFLAASRVVFSMDWYASASKLGMIGTYDPSIILDSIKAAKSNSDYVVIFVHWGVERENYPVDYQRSLARQYIDAGADAVVGCHPHVMQGFEFYKGKPIAYSLGNFWFNSSTRDSGMLKLYLDADSSVKVQLLPVTGENTYTHILTKDADRKTYFDFMQSLSYNTVIDKDGYITEKADEAE